MKISNLFTFSLSIHYRKKFIHRFSTGITQVSTTPCASPYGFYTPLGCESYCHKPDTAGYVYTAAVNYWKPYRAGWSGTTTVTNIACNNPGGYKLNGLQVTTTVCASANGTYAVSNCDAFCNEPTGTAGYLFSGASDTTPFMAGWTAATTVSGIACNLTGGYYMTAPSVTTVACGSPGALYTPQNCATAACTRPVIAGYNFNSEADLQTASFDVNVTCAYGYFGTVVVTTCGALHNTPYSVSGCNPATCTRPTGTTGYDYNAEADLRTPFLNVSVTCSYGYHDNAAE